ncbi:hypothetical protein [Microbulbifer sp. JMSA002]|uniref:hypothetical protein n=1 Tax=Microbulbifer sp. JMSA002 TaxID=3243368 RepID=UPI004039E30B
MAFYPIRQLGERGINVDTPPFELPVNEFSAGKNVRFANGAAQTMPSPKILEPLAEAPVWGAGWVSDGVPQLAYASQTELYIRENETFVKRTNSTDFSTGYSPSENWQSLVWGESVIFNNGVDVPQIREPTDTEFKALPNWPSNLRAKLLSGYKNFMVALGITEDGVNYPNTVRWSTEAEPGQVPWTWDVVDLSGLAGANPVDSGASELVDCLPLGGANIIYSQEATYLMQFVGGQYVFAFDKLLDQGILCRDAVAAFDKFHFVIGSTEIFVHDGSSTRPVAHRRANKTFYNEVGDRTKVRCVANHKTKEVWTYYTTGAGNANRAMVYNWLDNTFTFVDVPGVACAVFAPKQGEIVTWEELTQSWADLTQSWGEFADTAFYPVMYYFSSDGAAHTLQEADFLSTASTTQSVYLERTGIDLDQLLKAPTKQWKLIRQIVPQIHGTGKVRITVGGASTAMGDVHWRQPREFDVAKGLKVDVRLKARYLAIKIQSVDAGFWRLTGWDLDLIPVDGR